MKRLTATVPIVQQMWAPRGSTVDMSKGNFNSDQVEFFISMCMFRFFSPEDIRSLNLSYNNLEKLPYCVFPQLENLTCLYVNDNRLSSLPESMKFLERLQELDLRNNQLKRLDVVRELPNLRKLLVEGNPLILEEIRSLFKHVEKTTRTISVDIEGNVTCIYGNKSFAYSSTFLYWSKDCVSLALS